jgi:hypothetical protein
MDWSSALGLVAATDITAGDDWLTVNAWTLDQVFDSESAVRAYPQERSRRLWQDRVFASLPFR